MQRYYGYDANRSRGERKAAQAAQAAEAACPDAELRIGADNDPELPLDGVTIVEPVDFNRGDARRRWAGPRLQPQREGEDRRMTTVAGARDEED